MGWRGRGRGVLASDGVKASDGVGMWGAAYSSLGSSYLDEAASDERLK